MVDPEYDFLNDKPSPRRQDRWTHDRFAHEFFDKHGNPKKDMIHELGRRFGHFPGDGFEDFDYDIGAWDSVAYNLCRKYDAYAKR